MYYYFILFLLYNLISKYFYINASDISKYFQMLKAIILMYFEINKLFSDDMNNSDT